MASSHMYGMDSTYDLLSWSSRGTTPYECESDDSRAGLSQLILRPVCCSLCQRLFATSRRLHTLASSEGIILQQAIPRPAKRRPSQHDRPGHGCTRSSTAGRRLPSAHKPAPTLASGLSLSYPCEGRRLPGDTAALTEAHVTCATPSATPPFVALARYLDTVCIPYSR